MRKKTKKVANNLNINADALLDAIAEYNQDDIFLMPLDENIPINDFSDSDSESDEQWVDNISFEERRTPIDVMAAMPLLSPEEERSLTLAYYETQDIKAYDTLVERNMRLVIKCAWKILRGRNQTSMINIDDMISEGALGLMHAITKYDPYRGTRLSTYAYPWIVQKIARYASSQHSIFRIPYNVGSWLTRHAESVAKWKEGRLDEIPENELTKLTQYAFLMQSQISLNEPKNDDWDDSLADLIPLDEDMNANVDKQIDLEHALNLLTSQERKLLSEIFGLDHEPIASKKRKYDQFDAIAKQYNTSREDIINMFNDAINKIREAWSITVTAE